MTDLRPTVGGDIGVWATKLLNWIGVSVNKDGSLLIGPNIVAATPTGVAATDTANLQAWVAAINASGGNVDAFLNIGSYVVNAAIGTITVPNVRIYGRGRALTTIDASALAASTYLLQALGTIGTAINLTADAAVGASTVTVSSAASFAAGKQAKIWSSAHYYPGSLTGGDDISPGEQAIVESIASNVLTLDRPLAGGPYATADTAQIAPVTALTGFSMEGIAFKGAGAGGLQIAVLIDCVTHGHVRDCSFVGFEHRNIDVYDCINFVVEKNFIDGDYNSTDPTAGYGISVQYASQEVVLEKNVLINLRNAISHGSSTPAIARAGINRRGSVVGNKIRGSINRPGAAIDSHDCSEDLEISGNKIYGGNGGIDLRIPSATITGNTIRNTAPGGSGTPAIRVRNQSAQPTSLTIVGNRIKGFTSGGIVVTDDSTRVPLGGQSTAGIAISANVVEDGSGSVSISVQSAASWRYVNVTVSGNIVNNPATSTSPIELIAVDYATVTGNTVNGFAPSGNFGGIRMNNCNHGTVSGNVVVNASATNGFGIYLSNTCTAMTVTGNNVSGAKTGINLDATSTGCIVKNNDVSTGNTTPLNYNAGTGHRISGNLGYVPGNSGYTMGASPDTYTNTAPYPVRRVISGGTISNIQLSTTGAAFFPTGQTAGVFPLNPGDQLKVTYSVIDTTDEIVPAQGS